MEKSGVLVHGFVSDSALTNRKVWSELGISGKLEGSHSYIEHFKDSNRKFFAFSDTSQLIKNVRNRLYNKRELLVRNYLIYFCIINIIICTCFC